MAEIREIAEELATVCLSNEVFVSPFRPSGKTKADAVTAGERVGEFYNAILKALEQKASDSPGPKVHQF